MFKMAAKMAYEIAAKIYNCHIFAPKWQRFILQRANENCFVVVLNNKNACA